MCSRPYGPFWANLYVSRPFCPPSALRRGLNRSTHRPGTVIREMSTHKPKEMGLPGLTPALLLPVTCKETPLSLQRPWFPHLCNTTLDRKRSEGPGDPGLPDAWRGSRPSSLAASLLLPWPRPATACRGPSSPRSSSMLSDGKVDPNSSCRW